MKKVLRTHGLSKVFGDQKAVNEVNINIFKGDIYGLIGQNGAGKTTFMRMISGLAKPSSGTIELFEGDNLELARRRMGCTIESPALYPHMTATENMMVYSKLLGLGKNKVISDLLYLVGLSQTENKKAKDFSLGMKQRLMIAIALLGEPEFLILDEPMNGLDPLGIKEIRDLLLKLNMELGLTILVSSHILDELSKLATRYGVISQGQLIKEFSNEELNSKGGKGIRLNVNEPKEALKLLHEHITIKTDQDNDDLIIFEDANKCPEIVRLMVNNNIDVKSISVQDQNLEEYFMTLVGGNIA
ncbi:ATP-binding cassette domain-containing protein [Acidaminobacter sp. JC074]|uniref:ATP-binding cassette domain-containing protein n=1 Tax=Acidaminobacter sp. JC074 TaxID=2530199 RepID=UPI001F108B5C|nr:ATP-binding cassette domain-containing protein [Acidaminobacter sp. JC074]MCH4891362.1 ATP-binding cassette domain-containing protein [Acidaminobacter sp. JC074]